MSNAADLEIDGGAGAAGDGNVVSAPSGDLSRGRRIAFRVVAVLTALWLLLMHVFGLTEVVLMWLPGETLASMFGEDAGSVAELEMHRSHFMIIGIVAWATVLAAVVQVRKPHRRVAAMLQLVLIAAGGTVLYGLSGTLGEWLLEEGTVLVPVLLVASLHPRAKSLLRWPSFDRAMAGLAAVAAIPWTVFVVDHARLQLVNAGGDIHAEPEHWATAALMGIVIAGCAFIGAGDHDGWRLPAWVAAVASVLYGVHSLVFPGPVSAASTVWAIGAVVWGLVFAVSVLRRSRGAKRPALR